MSTSLHAADEHHALPPPQFGLRSLLIAVTLLSGLFAILVAIGPTWSVMFVLFASLVLLHVVGNAIGTRLRDGEARREFQSPRENSGDLSPDAVKAVIVPARRLQENTSLRRPWLVAGTIMAAISGTIGGVTIAAIVGEKLTIPGLALGILSASVLGGLFGFMACTLWIVARTALREALEASEDSAAVANENPRQ